jgi:hypothetical protein
MPYGREDSYDNPRHSYQRHGGWIAVESDSRRSSAIRRLFPSPASPTIETSLPLPVPSSASTRRRSFNASSRPTSGALTPRPRSEPGVGFGRMTRNALTGLLFPLTSIRPSSSTSNVGAICRYVSSATWIVPGCAVYSIRAARFTASPIAVYSTRRSDPTSPTTARPVLMPTRTSNSRPRSRFIASR